jgi:hypothetical protein
MDADKNKARMDRTNSINKIQPKDRLGLFRNPVNLVNPVYSLSLYFFIGVYRRSSADNSKARSVA